MSLILFPPPVPARIQRPNWHHTLVPTRRAFYSTKGLPSWPPLQAYKFGRGKSYTPEEITAICNSIDPEEIWNATQPKPYSNNSYLKRGETEEDFHTIYKWLDADGNGQHWFRWDQRNGFFTVIRSLCGRYDFKMDGGPLLNSPRQNRSCSICMDKHRDIRLRQKNRMR